MRRRRPKISARRYAQAVASAGRGATSEDIAKYLASPVLARYFAAAADLAFIELLQRVAQELADRLPSMSAPPSQTDVQAVAIANKTLNKRELLFGWSAVLLAALGIAMKWGFVALVAWPIYMTCYFIASSFARNRFFRTPIFRNAVQGAVRAICFERPHVEYWRQLDWRQLEIQVTALFSRLGYRAHTTPASGDKGVDVIAESGKDKIVIQCKQYSNPAQRNLVSELLGVMTAERSSRGILICTGGFTSNAEEYAAQHRVELWDLEDLSRVARALR